MCELARDTLSASKRSHLLLPSFPSTPAPKDSSGPCLDRLAPLPAIVCARTDLRVSIERGDDDGPQRLELDLVGPLLERLAELLRGRRLATVVRRDDSVRERIGVAHAGHETREEKGRG